ncbi:hypothetical protein [Mechercharimyces sp. CAU 1602]|uniref:hypothetical protein n=1 Tax=Mechercharimyces sp. CAU 1602 TaxID=2973933 RepID=UPI002162D2F7|nr:hypothetical protein [Mechercharimyces sp. CAU 1602]
MIFSVNVDTVSDAGSVNIGNTMNLVNKSPQGSLPPPVDQDQPAPEQPTPALPGAETPQSPGTITPPLSMQEQMVSAYSYTQTYPYNTDKCIHLGNMSVPGIANIAQLFDGSEKER